MKEPTKLFVASALADESYAQELRTHLRFLEEQGRLRVWPEQIDPGTNRREEFTRALDQAQIILMLISTDFLASDYYADFGMDYALQRHASGNASVIPILIRPADLRHSPLGRLTVLPGSNLPISLFDKKEQAWREITTAINGLILGQKTSFHEYSPGARIDNRYKVIRTLTAGSAGRTYEALDQLGRKVAVRVMRSDSFNREDHMQFQDESAVLNAILSHSGFVNIYRFWKQDSMRYAVMENIDGESLSARLERKHKLELHETLEFARQIADAIAILHGYNIVHCDLKPDNIMILRDLAAEGYERVKILDFGLAKNTRDSHMTISGNVKFGTPGYMAPEIWIGMKETGAADVYSLGVIMYEMIAGMLPFEERVLFHFKYGQQPLSLREIEPSIPIKVDLLIKSMLNNDPLARPTMRYLSECLSAKEKLLRNSLLDSIKSLFSGSNKTSKCTDFDNENNGEWRLVLDGHLEDLNEISLENLLVKLNTCSKNFKISLKKIEPGSVILVLDSTMEGFSIIKELYTSGRLSKILGRRVKEVRWDGDSPATVEPRCADIEPGRRMIFYSYAIADERHRLQLELRLALLKREGLVDDWHHRRISPGMERKIQIHHHLKIADLILLLISPDFIAADYCFNGEMTQAIRQHERGASRVVPILLRATDWRTAPFAHLQFLPREGKPITEWKNRDRAWLTVVDGIRQVVAELKPR